jgi:hypothetical protein
LPQFIIPFVVTLIVLAGFILINKSSNRAVKIFCLSYGLICLISTITVNPLMKGLDVIYSKPVATVIQEIVNNNPDAKWISASERTFSSFLIVNGAPTIDSVNFVPNFELWEILDPSGKDSYIYNRYAQLGTILTSEEQSGYELIQADSIILYITLKDLIELGVSYVFSPAILSGNEYVALEVIYAEYGAYIYEVIPM